MSATYWEAPDVAEVGAKLIEAHHPDLVGIRIDYLFRDPPAASGGKTVLGKARKISGLNAYLARHDGPFFVMEIAGAAWEEMSDRRRRALVDHELCHMGTDDNASPVVVSHDVEEFVAVVERHGLWSGALDSLSLAVQMAIPFEGGGADDRGETA